MKNTKLLIIPLIWMLSAAGFAQAKLNMFISYNRFLDKQKNTILLLDYQVPYRNLVFLAQNNGYFAELDVSVKLMAADSVAYEQNITDNIGIKSKLDAESNQKSYLNRVSFLLDKPKYKILFHAEDVNSAKQFDWTFKLETLPKGSLISDIELNSQVVADTLQYLAKFHRKNTLYVPEPSFLINKNQTDFVYLYFETYLKDPSVSALLNLSLSKDSLLVMDEYLDYQVKENTESTYLKIPLRDLSPGLYRGTVLIQQGERTEQREFEFVLFEEAEEQFFLFSNPDDEYELMRYFAGSKLPADWKNLSLDKKRRYGTQFWRSLATGINKKPAEAIKFVQERVDYANKNFGHLKAGWTSDMGRIYIRNGAPDDIQRDTSSDESRFVRKDFQIWKYSSGRKPVYLFIDIQMNGNYKLIYVENDDMETSNPDWIRFVGTDFDTGKLDN